MALELDPRYVFRDFKADGNPSSGLHNPLKPEIRALFYEWWQTIIALVADAGGIDLPNMVIRFEVTGGTANAIQATPDLPIPEEGGSPLFSIIIEQPNTGPVTINGKPLRTNSGNEIPSGGLVANGVYLFLDNGDEYRLLSDYATAAIAAAAEAAAVSAEQDRIRSEDAAQRAETAASGVEFPVSYAPQVLSEAQQEQARSNIGVVPSFFQTSKASIKHVRKQAPFTDLIYDLIEVRNPKPGTVKKVFAPGVAPDGVVTRVSAREFIRDSDYIIAVNADGWRNADGSSGAEQPEGRPMGLQIAEGVLYQDWLTTENRTQSLVVMRDGSWAEANKDDGISGAQWIANGAEWSVSWGMFCVRNGQFVDLSGGYIADVPSARTVIGKRPNGDIVIAMIEGISYDYGAGPNRCGELMLHLGCEDAYICDGGGSTQCWWKNAYAPPSSDRNGNYLAERGVPTFFVIDPEQMPMDYDTGLVEIPVNAGFTGMTAKYPFAMRQRGNVIEASIRINGSFPIDTQTTFGQAYPIRFHSTYDGLTRFPVSGGAGTLTAAVTGGARTFSVTPKIAAMTYIAGSGFWPAVHTDIDRQPA